jgi:integrase
VVEAALKENPEGYLSERNASMYEHGTLVERTRAVFAKVGIKTSETDADGHTKITCGFHSLRHTFVSMSIDAGVNPLLVQRIVGHSSASMTDRYYHADRKAVEEGIAKMPDFAA